jgi:phosphoribosylformimino-5-aminoimidazole carboxamide ribotide isomerase
MTRFRPCIDLYQGKVRQIVGGSYKDSGPEVNFTSDRPSSWYAELYKKDGLMGGHVIMLGPGNEQAALEALAVFPNGMQVGGGITIDNAEHYLDNGASHVIVTSWIFPGKELDRKRLDRLSNAVGKERLVLDLSCRKSQGTWFIAKDKWQTLTKTEITAQLLQELQQYCAEFLIHAADVEGKCRGIDEELVAFLGNTIGIPATYAGGARHISDLERVAELSRGKVDLTVGSALDIFGGNLVKYSDCVSFNRSRKI